MCPRTIARTMMPRRAALTIATTAGGTGAFFCLPPYSRGLFAPAELDATGASDPERGSGGAADAGAAEPIGVLEATNTVMHPVQRILPFETGLGTLSTLLHLGHVTLCMS